jgi:hypothetical protein
MGRRYTRPSTLKPGTLPPKPVDQQREFFRLSFRLFLYWLIHKIIGK